MASFDKAITFVLKHEGGYANNPNDTGGATNFGLSSRFLNSCKLDGHLLATIDTNDDSVISASEIKNIPIPIAKEVYRLFFWLPNLYEKINSQEVANYIFDFSVHAGAYKANYIAQKAANALGINPIKQDGLIGKATIGAINLIPSDKMLEKLKEFRINFYRDVVKHNRTQKVFLNGWIKRANDG
jgi:lysozyme family protein